MKPIHSSNAIPAAKPLLLFLIVALSLPAAAAQRVAVINLRNVFDNYYKTKAADASIKERADEFDKEKKVLVEQFQKLTETYKKALEDANNQAISAEERENRKKAAENKLLAVREMEQTLSQFDRQALSTLDEQEKRMRGKLLEEIQAVIQAKAKAGNFTLVLDTAAETRNRTPAVLFSSGEDDITEPVLADLNSSAPQDFQSTDNKKPGSPKEGDSRTKP